MQKQHPAHVVAYKGDRTGSRSELQVSFVFYRSIAMRIATTVRRSRPRSGSVRITVAYERIHGAGPIDRYTLTPSILLQTAAVRSDAIYQRCSEILDCADVGVRLGCTRAAA